MDVEKTRDEKIDELLAMHGDIKEFISLMRDVQGAHRTFVKVGNAVKWVLGLVLPLVGAYYAFKSGSSHK